MIKDSKKPGFTVVEILIASGLLLTLLSLLGFLFRNNIKAGLQYADFALQQKRLAIALERVAEATRRSTLAGISHKGNVIAIQPRKTVGNDGKIVWSEHLEVFWYAGSAVWYRNLNSSQAGVALSASEPVQLTDDELHEEISKIIKANEQLTIKDMGKIMGELKEKFSGRMDFGKASGIVKALLK